VLRKLESTGSTSTLTEGTEDRLGEGLAKTKVREVTSRYENTCKVWIYHDTATSSVPAPYQFKVGLESRILDSPE